MKKKYYHVVLKKNGHFYYEVFQEDFNTVVDMRTTYPVISYFNYTDEERLRRTFTFKTIFDLKHNHTQNKLLTETMDEERLFFLSSIEVIDTIKKLYLESAQSHISHILKRYDTFHTIIDHFGEDKPHGC